MKKLIVACLFAFTMIPILAMAGDVEAPQWTFDEDDADEKVETWAIHGMDALEIDEVKDSKGDTRSVLLTSSQGGDPYFYPGGASNSSSYESFDGSEYDTLYLGVRANATSDWQIYYITEEDGAWAEAQRQNYTVEATGEFEDLEIPITRGGWNERTVVRFRIDPSTQANIEAEIDYISFVGVPGGESPVEPSGKLSAVWGNIKN